MSAPARRHVCSSRSSGEVPGFGPWKGAVGGDRRDKRLEHSGRGGSAPEHEEPGMKPFTFAIAMVEIVLLVVAIRANTMVQTTTGAGSEEDVATLAAGGGEATAVTVSADQRVFVGFPGRHPEVDGALAEVRPDGAIVPYPSREWNAWSLKSGLDPRRHF